MKNFNIKQYLNGQITKENCDHLVLVTKGYNDGLAVRIDYNCVLCHKKLKGKKQIVPTENRYVYHQMPNSTDQGLMNLNKIVDHLANHNQDKNEIDLVGMLNQVDPILNEYDQAGKAFTEDELANLFQEPAKTYQKK